MKVRKVRGRNKLGNISVSRSEYELARKLGIPIEQWVEQTLLLIAKKRKWTWYLNKEKNT